MDWAWCGLGLWLFVIVQYEVGESTHFCSKCYYIVYCVWLGVTKTKQNVWCVQMMLKIAFILTR